MKILIIISYLIANCLLSDTLKLEKVSLQLHWKYQFQFAGFIAAKEKGFYKEEGLDVELKESNPNIKIVEEVTSNRSNYAVGSSSIALSYLRGDPIKLVSSFFKRSAMVLITKPDIKYPKDLMGRKIMTNSKERFISRFKYMFKSQDVDVNKLIFIKHSYRIEDFITGKVDAITAFTSTS